MILKTRPYLEEVIRDGFFSGFPSCVKLAELGCSSGPNAPFGHLRNYWHHSWNVPKDEMWVSGVPSVPQWSSRNWLQHIFKSLPSVYEGLMKEKGGKLGNCFVTAMPGSFYGRLFPTRSLDFVHSSTSVHWLSQVNFHLEIYVQPVLLLELTNVSVHI